MTAVCACGCEQTPPVAKRTNARLGHQAGQPVRYINGHQGRPQFTRRVSRLGETVVFTIGTGDGVEYEVTIDACNAARVLAHYWGPKRREDGEVYAVRQEGGRTIYLHHFVLDLPSGPEVDHANGATLDCRRANLRECTHKENSQNRRRPRNNTTGFKGVCFHRQRGKWLASIGTDGKRFSLGLHLTAEDAARAYDTAAIRLFGSFARTNFSIAVAERIDAEGAAK